MNAFTLHRPNPPHGEDPNDPEPGAPPVEPDQGPVRPIIDPDPEHERIVDPEV
jgi:hypothetical protein